MHEPLPVVETLDESMAIALATKSEVERLRIGFRMWKSARSILRSAIGSEHPEWNPERVDREIAFRISHGVVDHGRN